MRFQSLFTYDPDYKGFVVKVPELPGCFSQGKTLDEATANIRDAIRGMRSGSCRVPAEIRLLLDQTFHIRLQGSFEKNLLEPGFGASLMKHNPSMADDLVQISERLRAMLPELRSKYGVGRLWVFGSHARGQASSESDLDVLVEFERPGISLFGFVGLEQEIGDLLGVKVDLVERSALRPEIGPRVIAEAVAV